VSVPPSSQSAPGPRKGPYLAACPEAAVGIHEYHSARALQAEGLGSVGRQRGSSSRGGRLRRDSIGWAGRGGTSLQHPTRLGLRTARIRRAARTSRETGASAVRSAGRQRAAATGTAFRARGRARKRLVTCPAPASVRAQELAPGGPDGGFRGRRRKPCRLDHGRGKRSPKPRRPEYSRVAQLGPAASGAGGGDEPAQAVKREGAPGAARANSRDQEQSARKEPAGAPVYAIGGVCWRPTACLNCLRWTVLSARSPGHCLLCRPCCQTPVVDPASILHR